MKTYFSFFLVFAFFFASAQEIIDKEAFKKCKKEFNKKTCLVDNDGDGVLNYFDACKDISGVADNGGCPWPDSDNDGVLDKDDACPTVAGPFENNGCPWQDKDGDGTLDKDDKCPTVVGSYEKQGCPKIYEPHTYSKEELEKVKNEFLESTKNIDYNKLGDIVFSKIGGEEIKSNIIVLEIASSDIVADCGDFDYSPLNLRVNLASQNFWNERNFKKFVDKFPNKIILPFSEDKIVNKKIQSFKNIHSRKFNNNTYYNSKNNFTKLKIAEIDFDNTYRIYFILNDTEIIVIINEKSNLPRQHFEIKKEDILGTK